MAENKSDISRMVDNTSDAQSGKFLDTALPREGKELVAESQPTPVYDMFVSRGLKTEADVIQRDGKQGLGYHIAVLDHPTIEASEKNSLYNHAAKVILNKAWVFGGEEFGNEMWNYLQKTQSRIK